MLAIVPCCVPRALTQPRISVAVAAHRVMVTVTRARRARRTWGEGGAERACDTLLTVGSFREVLARVAYTLTLQLELQSS